MDTDLKFETGLASNDFHEGQNKYIDDCLCVI